MADIGRGKSKHRPRDAAFLYGGKHPFIQTGDVRNAGLYLDKYTQTYSDAGLKQSKLWDENTLCITIAANIAETTILKIKACFPDSIIGLIPYENEASVLFIKHQFDKFKIDVQNLSQGIAQANLNQEKLSSIQFRFPSLIEQEKIATFLSLIDQRIETQNKIIEALKSLKSTLRNRLFKKLVDGASEDILVRDILTYEQPTRYLVTDTDYSADNNLTPVLTANKSFILGYTHEKKGVYNKGECIIFDDFTMDLKFVEFPFKVKSSAIKILTGKPGVNLRFIFEFFSFLNLSTTEHKRHYISEIELISLTIPNNKIQSDIAEVLSKIDRKIDLELNVRSLLFKQKKNLLSNLFI